MTNQPTTIAHPFAPSGASEVFEAVAGVPLHECLEAVLAGLRDLMTEPTVSNQATLIYFAADAALALVYSAHAGVAPGQGGAA